MTMEELKARGAICFEKIQKGLEGYKDVTITMDDKRAVKHFKSLRDEYGAANAFTDFYYFRLDEDAQEMIEEELSPAEISYVHSLASGIVDPDNDIVFPLDDNLLRIVCKLNASETLFSTIYFAGGARPRSTWWGNYEKEYICFTDKAEEMK